jgi:ribosomal protein S18 acetylase RimI-like enzyme
VCGSTIWSPTFSSVSAGGATCQIGPSPTARAVRIDNLRAPDAAALEALLAAIPADPPYDIALEAGDPLVPLVREARFEPYASTVPASRAIEGLPPGDPADGVRLLTYDNDMADRYVDAEFDAMDGLRTYRAMGRPTGYAQGAGYGDFTVALRADRIIGFCFTQVPEGIIWWLGVRPDERRNGVARMLVDSAARAVRAAGGTHLIADPEDTPEARAFLAALGFRARTPRELLIRRG